MSKIVVSLHDLRSLTNTVTKHINDEYVKTYRLCQLGKDLPGIWPKFYLYVDLTWSIGYEVKTELELLCSMDIAKISPQDLMLDLVSRLPRDCEFTPEAPPPPPDRSVHLAHHEIVPDEDSHEEHAPKTRSRKGSHLPAVVKAPAAKRKRLAKRSW